MHEDLVKRLRKEASCWCANCCYRSGDCNCFAPDDRKKDCDVYTKLQAADAIEELQDTAQAQDKALKLCADQLARRWISVAEKLPEKEDEAVIVWEKQGFALIDWRHDNKWAILDNNYGIATHWMPLPEHPVEKEAK